METSPAVSKMLEAMDNEFSRRLERCEKRLLEFDHKLTDCLEQNRREEWPVAERRDEALAESSLGSLREGHERLVAELHALAARLRVVEQRPLSRLRQAEAGADVSGTRSESTDPVRDSVLHSRLQALEVQMQLVAASGLLPLATPALQLGIGEGGLLEPAPPKDEQSLSRKESSSITDRLEALKDIVKAAGGGPGPDLGNSFSQDTTVRGRLHKSDTRSQDQCWQVSTKIGDVDENKEDAGDEEMTEGAPGAGRGTGQAPGPGGAAGLSCESAEATLMATFASKVCEAVVAPAACSTEVAAGMRGTEQGVEGVSEPWSAPLPKTPLSVEALGAWIASQRPTSAGRLPLAAGNVSFLGMSRDGAALASPRLRVEPTSEPSAPHSGASPGKRALRKTLGHAESPTGDRGRQPPQRQASLEPLGPSRHRGGTSLASSFPVAASTPGAPAMNPGVMPAPIPSSARLSDRLDSLICEAKHTITHAKSDSCGSGVGPGGAARSLSPFNLRPNPPLQSAASVWPLQRPNQASSHVPPPLAAEMPQDRSRALSTARHTAQLRRRAASQRAVH